MKKALKIVGITFLIIVTLLITIPFIFQSQIKDMIKVFINDNLNAKVEFSDVGLSFIKSFPQAHVGVTDLVITNLEPFKDETFASIKEVSFTMSIKELFKSANDGAIVINSIFVDQALITLKSNESGVANYDIAKEDENTDVDTEESEDSSFALDIDDYKIQNSALTYIDEASKMTIHLTELNHEGHGTFSGDVSELDTKSEVNVSFTMDSTNYLSNNSIKLDALIGLDLKNSIYTFKDNKALINQLPLHFDGFVQLLENGQNIDITFENPESDFKNFLALIPKEYSKDIADVETTGDFKVKGIVKGMVTDTTIPKLDINIASKDASFKYPDLPKGIKNITIDTSIKNTTGLIDDTFVDINTLDFMIDSDVFKSSINIKNLTKNMFVNANIDGVLNLANITKAYPVDMDNDLTGILIAKLQSSFDMEALETNAYSRIKNSGFLNITDFTFSSEDLQNPLHISEASVVFNPEIISLKSFNAKTGASNLSATGTLQNFLGFILSDGKLLGNFNLNSSMLKINDFMTDGDGEEVEETTNSDSEPLKIPDFLDCTINAYAKTVVYDNLNLKDVKGKLIIKDQQATLQNITASLFDGILAFSGNVSTKEETPTFDMNLAATEFDISKSFSGLELLQKLIPIGDILNGKLNTDVKISGNLDKELFPDLNTVSGNALGELLNASISNKNQGELFNKLDGALGFIDFEKMNLEHLKTMVEFADGKVSVKPFDLKYKDIDITVSGAHGFDKKLDYSAVFNVPAKYLGSEVNNLIGKIDSDNAKNITVPVTANIGGSYTSPKVKTDLNNGVSSLTKQLVEIQKQKMLNKGKNEVNSLIGDVIGGNKTKTNLAKDKQSDAAKNLVNDIIGGDKKTDDTTEKNSTTNTVKDAIGGFLGGKKK